MPNGGVNNLGFGEVLYNTAYRFRPFFIQNIKYFGTIYHLGHEVPFLLNVLKAALMDIQCLLKLLQKF
jgi:hypothetical protein